MTSSPCESPSPLVSGRVEHAFAARESSLYSYALMEGMISQTLTPYTHLPGVPDVLAAGLSPLTDPGSSPFPVHQFRAHRTAASMFAHEGCVYLYSLGTAAQVNTPQGDNAWMTTLCDFIREFRPVHLYVANFNRLIRSAIWSGDLLRAVEDTGTVLHANGIEIDVATHQGRVLWQTLAMLADLERDSIVHRLFAGTINKYNRGQWVLSGESVPPGYRLEDGRPVLDDDQVERVRALITLLADPSLSARQVVDAAGATGLSSPTIRRIHGPDATYAHIRRADSKVRALVRCSAVWRDGIYEAQVPNPIRGATRVGDLPVVAGDGSRPHGFICFRYELGVPDGGWAPTEVLAAVARRRTDRRDVLGRGDAPDGGAVRRRRRSLAGWVSLTTPDGDRLWLSGDSGNYLLMRQDGAPIVSGATGASNH